MFNGRRQPSGGGTSRMTRECQVRFCERLGVQFPGPTRPGPTSPNVRDYGEYWGVSGPSSDMEIRRWALLQVLGHSAFTRTAGVALMTLDVRDAVLTHPVFCTLTGQRSEPTGPG